MKKLLAALGLLALYCAWRRTHDAARQPIGGFRCIDCRRPFADLSEAGTLDRPGVDPRRIQGARRRPGIARVM